jgi:cytochrome c oxidase subunit 3
MVTTVERPTKIDERAPVTGGGSGHGGFFTEDGNLNLVMDRRSPHPSSTAVYVALAGIGMIFAALTSALVVRKGGATDWKSFTLPSILYVNTLVLLASGFVLEVGRRAVGKFMVAPDHQHAKPTFWFYLTLGLGLLFVAGQYIAWLQLRREGLYLATNQAALFSTCLRLPMPFTCWVDLEDWCSSSRGCSASLCRRAR